jgi:hypothetical protein
MAILESILAGCLAFILAALAGASADMALLMGALTTGIAFLYFGLGMRRK